jgi:F-type H+-transporting ATPase subunit a
MQLSPDETILWQWRFVTINATLVYTWVAMAVLVMGAWLVTRRLRTGPDSSTQQQLLETIVSVVDAQIHEITQRKATALIPFVGTLFLFIATANLLAVIPGYLSPAGSLSTDAALATCVFVAVPTYGIARLGAGRYFRQYTQPSVLMLPFNIIGEVSRTVALAIRLFGNVMSGQLIVAILLAVVPLFLPVVMQLFGMLVGVIQAYIFSVLATVYIASATASAESRLAQPNAG